MLARRILDLNERVGKTNRDVQDRVSYVQGSNLGEGLVEFGSGFSLVRGNIRAQGKNRTHQAMKLMKHVKAVSFKLANYSTQ